MSNCLGNFNILSEKRQAFETERLASLPYVKNTYTRLHYIAFNFLNGF